MSLLKVNEVQNFNGSSLTLTASTVSTSAQLNTGGNVSVTGSLNVSDNSTTRTNLGIGSIATQDSNNVSVTGGSITSTTIVPTSSFTFRNKIINGDMRIDQRNAGSEVTIASTVQYTLDRWRPTSQSTTSVMKCQQVTDAPDGFANSLKMTSLASTSPGTGDSYAIFQAIEDKNYTNLAWGTSSAKTVTMSFYVKSSVTGTFSGALVNQLQNRSHPFIYSISSADTWEYKTITIPGDTSGTWSSFLRVWISLGQGTDKLGTAGSWASSNYRGAIGEVTWVNTNAATFYITGVQLEEGTVATPFEYRPISVELSLCQRYGFGTSNYRLGRADDNTFLFNVLVFPTTLRASPSFTITNGSYAVNSGNAGTPAIVYLNTDTAVLYNSSSNWTTSAFVDFSGFIDAEL
jgi:hypothetical protein